MIDYLFVCSANLMRSPTAEHVARLMGYRATSAGCDARICPPRLLDGAVIEAAHRIVCMEQSHAQVVLALDSNAHGRLETWGIPDEFEYCDPQLIKLIRLRLESRYGKSTAHGRR